MHFVLMLLCMFNIDNKMSRGLICLINEFVLFIYGLHMEAGISWDYQCQILFGVGSAGGFHEEILVSFLAPRCRPLMMDECESKRAY